MPKNKLDVTGSDQLIHQFKEEMAEEFGLYRPLAEREAVTPKILNEKKKSKKDK